VYQFYGFLIPRPGGFDGNREKAEKILVFASLSYFVALLFVAGLAAIPG